MCPKSGRTSTKGKFDDGWDAFRQKVFPRQKELGIIPADAELSRHDPDVPDWEGLSPEQQKLYARLMEVFAGYLTHTDYHIGRLLDCLKDIGEFDNTLIMVISDNGASPQGGPTGTTNETQFFNNAQESLEESLDEAGQAGRAGDLQPLPLGLGVGGQHALPPLATRDLSRRHERPLHRPLATGHPGQGRNPHPVRPCHRHGAHGVRGTGHRAA